jgi:rhamnosyltransferase
MISLIIPTLNGAVYLERLFNALGNQRVMPEEIIVIDSSSSDGSADIVESFGAKVIIVDGASFDHGGTRNLGIKNSAGDIIIFLTQDVLPADENAVERLVEAFFADEQVGCTYGRQIPFPDATVFAAHSRLFNYGETSFIKLWEEGKRGIKVPFLSNSFAAYRRKALDEIGLFKEDLISTEDTYAGARLLMAGYKIAYSAGAMVYHSHNYTIQEEFERYFDIGVFHCKEKWIMETFGSAEEEGRKFVLSELLYIAGKRAYGLLPEFIARNSLKYIGFALGTQHEKLPLKIIKKISKNKNYWTKNRQ